MNKNLIFRLNPVVKLGALILIIALLLCSDSLLTYAAVFFFLSAVILAGRLSPLALFHRIKPLCYFLVMIAAVHLFFTPGDPVPPFPLWKIEITWQGLLNGGEIFFRFLLLILASSILTMTTPPLELAGGLETIFSPFGLAGLPVSRFSRMVVLTLQFIPVVFSEGENALKKVADDTPGFHSLGLLKKTPYFVSMVEGIFIRSFRYADRLLERNGEAQGKKE